MNKKNKHIFIIGMMGSGKSSLAPILSKKLKTPFIDTDADLTSILKLDTEEIFTTFSEKKFRILESTYFLEHIKNSQHIYATGGGIIINKKNRDALHSFGTTILLQAPIHVIYARLIKQVEQSRPLFVHSQNKKSIEDLSIGDVNKGILKTGDLAYFDEEGYFFIEGRNNRFVKVFGNRISLNSLEKLITIKGFKSVVTGVDDKLVIYVIEVPNLSAADLRKEISESIGINMIAINVILVDDFPRTDSGKINYKELNG